MMASASTLAFFLISSNSLAVLSDMWRIFWSAALSTSLMRLARLDS